MTTYAPRGLAAPEDDPMRFFNVVSEPDAVQRGVFEAKTPRAACMAAVEAAALSGSAVAPDSAGVAPFAFVVTEWAGPTLDAGPRPDGAAPMRYGVSFSG